MKSKKFDVIIFGASGCIGRCAVLRAVEVLKGFEWAIAGKSEQKMQLMLDEISMETGKNLKNVHMFTANAHDGKNLETVVAKCKVLVNCCGPYYLIAENILDTCIFMGTHYVDMSIDPYFNELMELKYHERALQREVYIISSCGFHTFPIEMALNFMKKHFEGTINSVEAFVRYNFGGFLYFSFFHSIWSTTAWLSLLRSCVNINDLSVIRDQLRTESIPCLLPILAIEELQYRSKYHENGIMVHFPFMDQQTVERSQYMFYTRNKQRPIQFCKYIEFPSYLWAIIFIIWCLVICLLSQFKVTRNILEKYPKLFSLGVFSSEGPNPYLLEMSSYKIRMCAKGWSNMSIWSQVEEDDDDSVVDQHMTIEISGENPFYCCGCTCLLLSAKTILEEKCKMPGSCFDDLFLPQYKIYILVSSLLINFCNNLNHNVECARLQIFEIISEPTNDLKREKVQDDAELPLGRKTVMA